MIDAMVAICLRVAATIAIAAAGTGRRPLRGDLRSLHRGLGLGARSHRLRLCLCWQLGARAGALVAALSLHVAAAIAAGADGVMLGTRLVATHEANAHTDYKQRLLRASGEDTVITHVYGPEFPAFNPMRVIRNDTINQWEKRIDELPHDRTHLESIGKTLFAGQEKEVKPFDSIIPVRETTGDFEQMPMLAGQGVGLVDEIEAAGVVIERIMDESARVIAAIQQT